MSESDIVETEKKGWLSRLVGGRYMFLPPEYGPENLGENNVLALASAVADSTSVMSRIGAFFVNATKQKLLADVPQLRRDPVL